MKNLKRIFIAIALIFAVGVSANAQVKFGVKAGVALNELKLSDNIEGLYKNLDASNRAGFTGGVMLEVMLPVFNLGLDASVMYVHRSSEINFEDIASIKTNNDYIEVPVNLKWKIGLPLVDNFVAPYIFTGPSFSFLTSSAYDAIKGVGNEDFKLENQKFNVDWNIGLGVEIMKHVQIGASYGFGITKYAKYVGYDIKGEDGIKSNHWTITAAYLF